MTSIGRRSMASSGMAFSGIAFSASGDSPRDSAGVGRRSGDGSWPRPLGRLTENAENPVPRVPGVWIRDVGEWAERSTGVGGLGSRGAQRSGRAVLAGMSRQKENVICTREEGRYDPWG